jgi:ADP-ribose pyrophosphatase YjhB (NUDIX family)
MNHIRPNALALVRKDGFLLAAKGNDEVTGKVFYRLMGGGIEFGELASEALKRELKEELGAIIIHEKLIAVFENIFEFNTEKRHEITFLFEADFKEEKLYAQEQIVILDKTDRYAEWISIQEIKEKKIILYPEEMINYL